MGRPLAVVLASGGMDSTVTAAVASQEYRLAFLHAVYGQRTARREQDAFEAVATHYSANVRLIVPFEHLAAIGGSSLTDPTIPIPDGKSGRTEIPSTYVPFRNGLLLSAAVNWAEVIGATAVFIGAVEEDSSGYPDCRKEFIESFGKAVRLGTRPGSAIRIISPLIELTKREIVLLGAKLGAPFHLTWSCYRDGVTACGRCDSCLLRLKGFGEAGIDDPVRYSAMAERPLQ